MSFQIIYTPLLDVKIHHDYFLDDGKKKFNQMNENKRKKQLLDYNVADFLSVIPTPQTKLHLQNHKIVFQEMSQGFMLMANVEEYQKAGESTKVFCPKIPFANDLIFTFELRFKDPYFDTYTDSDDAIENRFYYFSNIKPDSENNSFPNFLKVEDSHTRFLLKPQSSKEVLYDIITKEIAPIQPLGLQKIAAISADAINDPKNIEVFDSHIMTEKRNGLIGYMSFRIDGRGKKDILVDTTIEIPDIQGIPKQPDEVRGCLPNKVPDAVLNFKNRRMKWQYVMAKTNDEFKTKRRYPLTQKGFIPLTKDDVTPELEDVFFPNPDKENVKIEENKIYSEIFI